MVKLLVESGANITLTSDSGEQPIHLASANGHVDVVKYLLDKNATIWDVADLDLWTPLHLASYHGHLPIVRIYVDLGADVNLPVDEGATPLHMAAGNGHVEVVRYLLDQGEFFKKILKGK